MAALAFLHPALLGLGLHVASVRLRRAVLGHSRHEGSAEEILAAGLERCWSGRYLTASPGHYRQPWTRDTGFAAGALASFEAPWPARLLATLDWAVETWRRRGSHVTTTINPLLRWPVDVFDYGVDSLPVFLASLRALADGPDRDVAARAAALAREHRAWLAAEVAFFVDRVVDPETGLVRADRHYSAHRDTFRNGSTAYANTMVALLARTVAETGWAPDGLASHFRDGGPAAPPRWDALLRRHFWAGDRFRDRLGADETSGEANVVPFFTGVVDDPELLAAALGTLEREGYTLPYPLRFEAAHRTDHLLPAYRLWSADYQTTTAWTSIGSMYLALLPTVDADAGARRLAEMAALVERDGVHWEVLDDRGRPWRSASGLSVSDHSMLWGAILLAALRGMHAGPHGSAGVGGGAALRSGR